MTKEELAKQIMAEYEKDGEPISYEDALEVAEMEIKAKAEVKRYEQADKPKEKKKREVKLDTDKVAIVKLIADLMDTAGYDVTIANPQREICFGEYSLTLTKHRKKEN